MKKRRSIILYAILTINIFLIISLSFLIMNNLDFSNRNEDVLKKNVVNITKIHQDFVAFFEENTIRFRPDILEKNIENPAYAIPILMYHNVIPEPDAEYDGNRIVVDQFREHMQYLKENNFRTLTVPEFISYYNGEIDLPENSVLITFDDGFRAMKELVEPILIEYNFHSISFIIGEKTVNEPEWFVTPAEIIEMQERNFIDFQSHSYSFHDSGSNGRGRIETYSTEDFTYDNSLMQELLGNFQFFCYPFGHSEGSAEASLFENEIYFAVTTEFGYASRNHNSLQLPRIRINANTTVEDFSALLAG